MMRWIVISSMKARRAVVLCAVLILAFGVWSARSADVDVLPEFGTTAVEVQTEALGLSAEEVEQLITVPLEQDLLDGVAWLNRIESKSVPGLSSIHMIFDEGTDLYRARQVVQERISQAAGLPQVSRPPQMLQPQSSTPRTAMISLSSKTLTPLQIGVLARWTIRPALLSVPGVSNVAIWGQRERQLQVQVDPTKLRDKNVTLEQIVTTTGNALFVSPLTFLEASSPGTGGFIDTPNQRIGIQHNLPIVTPEDLAQIPIDEVVGAPLTLGDVATVVEDHQPLIGDAVLTGEGSGQEGFMIVVDKLPYATTSDVAAGVEKALDQLRPGLTGLDIDSSVFQPDAYAQQANDNLALMGVLAAVLLIIVLFAWFFNWRTALTALVAILLSVSVAFLVIQLFDVTINAIIWTGLAIALAAIVYDAVANVDDIAERLREDSELTSTTSSPARVVLAAALETGHTVVWASVIFAMALVPLFFIDGLSGDSFYPPLAAAALIAVVASVLVALVVTPALSVLLLGGRQRRESPVAALVRRGYGRIFRPVVRTPLKVLIVLGAVLIAAAFTATGFHASLLPELKDTNLMVHWAAPFGTSLPEMDRITSRAAEELRTLPGVKNVAAQVGQATLGDSPVGADSAEMWISVDDSADYDDTVNAVKAVVAGYPGLRHDVTTYSKNKMSEVLTQTKDEITVRVFGSDNLDTLYQTAGQVSEAIGSVNGITNARVTAPATEPTIEIEVDLAKAQQFAIKPGDVRRTAATLLSGLRVGNLFENQKVFDVVVWSTPQSRSSLTSVQDLLVDTPSGNHVRLGDVATVQVRSTSPSIEHQDISRFVDVTANVRDRDVDDVADDVRQQLKQVAFPSEYHAELVRDYTREQEAETRLLGFGLAAAVGIFLLLQAAFVSWRIAVIAFAMLPIALAGGVLAAWMDGSEATLATAAGLLAVLLITLRNNVKLFGRFRRLRTDDGLQLGPELVARGAMDAVASTVIAAVTIAILLLPAIVVGNIAGLELLHPMAVVVVGGLVTSLAATLLLLPALYLRFAPRREPEPLDFDAELRRIEAELDTTGVSAGVHAGVGSGES